MTAMTIELSNATELPKQNWFAPPAICSLSPWLREIHLGDARDVGGVLVQVGGAARGLHGFSPIPAGGTTVTNELVNKLREELGI